MAEQLVPSIKRYAPRADGVTSVALDEVGRRMVFAAHGALFTQSLEGVMARALVVPERGWALSSPWVAHGRVLALALAPGVPTTARRVVVVDGPSAEGQSFAVARDAAVAVVLDVIAGRVRVLDLAAGRARDVAAVSCAQDPQTPGLVAVRDDGGAAVVMAARSAHGEAALVHIDLVTGATHEVAPPLAGAGWRCASFAHAAQNGLVTVEQMLGDAPRCRVLEGSVERAVLEGAQQPCAPLAKDGGLLWLGADKVDARTGTGERALLWLDGAAARRVCPAEGTRVRAHRVDPSQFVVEGGRMALVIRIGEPV